MIVLHRSLCSDEAVAGQREWLVTNGIGGFASGTVAGFLSRRYHGLLVAALKPPLGRTLLVSKVDESVTYLGQLYPLFSNVWADHVAAPRGFIHLDQFHLEGASPVWTFAIADGLIEKRVWMQQGANTTYVRYDVVRASDVMKIEARVLVNYRDYHGSTSADDWRMNVERVEKGIRIQATEEATPFFLMSNAAPASKQHVWYRNFHLAKEAYRGLHDREDNLYAACFEVELHEGQSLTLVFSTDEKAALDGHKAYQAQKQHEDRLITKPAIKDQPDVIKQLVLAADQFIVSRDLPQGKKGHSVIAGYPWFGDWGRDTMIALPGLTLVTEQSPIAASMLKTYAAYVDKGMLPNRFPDASETPEYNTVDATFWYVEAFRAYLAKTGHKKLLAELFPVLEQIIEQHVAGTRHNIHVDPEDQLIYAGEPGVQLTWMDAKVGDWVVTPRIGKPVEINALWYHTLMCMSKFAGLLGKSTSRFDEMASTVKKSFNRFWNKDAGYCFDVIDAPAESNLPGGVDASLRPNQLFAVSLVHSPLSSNKKKRVVDACSRHLLTPCGMRSLSPESPAYIGHYGGTPHQRDGAYHQGTVWAWLIGAYVAAHFSVYKDAGAARRLLQPLLDSLSARCMGSIGEIYDGDPPFLPRGAFAQAWSVAEVLRVWALTQGRDSG